MVIDELIVTWMESEPAANHRDIDALISFLDGAEDRGDINLAEHAYFARDVMTSYACMTVGERAPFKLLYDAGHKKLLPLLPARGHINYAKGGALTIARTQYQCSEEMQEWYARHWVTGRPGRCQGLDVALGHEL